MCAKVQTQKKIDKFPNGIQKDFTEKRDGDKRRK